MITILTTTVVLLAAPQDPKTLSVEYTNGRTARVQVQSLDGDTVKLKALVLGGTMGLTKKLSDFKPASAFRIEVEARQPASFDAHFQLAKRAGALHLLGPAGTHGRAAIEQVTGKPDEQQKTQEVRGWAADTLEGWLSEAVAAGDIREAKHYLKLLSTRLNDQRTEAQLDTLCGTVDGLQETINQKRRDERQAKLDAKVRESIDRRLKPIYANIEKGDKLQRDAMAKSRHTSQSANLSEKAIDRYRSAWKATESLQKKHAEDQHLTHEVEVIGERLRTNAIRAALHAANMLTVQSDYKGAMEWANKILAFDPGNAEAKEMVRTIQIAAASASSDWGWGWRVVGGRGGGGTRY